MRQLKTPAELQRWSEGIKRRGLSIGLVPTMGYLHEGHISLIKRARTENDTVVLSIFINPSQFAPDEDYKKYPKNPSGDLKLARNNGVDVLYTPSVAGMYPAPFRSYVHVEGLSGLMCGIRRKNHFKGVATVVGKLFNTSMADRAYFGRKDFQQSVIIGQMIRDLNFKVTLRVLPIIRSRDGMALSSRNKYLSQNQREESLSIYRALLKAKKMIRTGTRDTRVLRSQIIRMLKKAGLRVDYVVIGNAKNLDSVKVIRKNTYIALAAFCGKTRLIDNMLIQSIDRISL